MKYGEILQLGRHKLMCGDATLRDDVMRLIGTDKINLVLTDPPYGMKVLDKNGMHSKKYKPAKLRKEVFLQGQIYPMLNGNIPGILRHNQSPI